MSDETVGIVPPIGEKPSNTEEEILSKSFPKLKKNEWKKTGKATGHPDDPTFDPDTYNCIAWSLCRDDFGWIWWMVDSDCNDDGIVQIEDFDCFYEEFGFNICANSTKKESEYKIRKVALFCKDGKPTHAAKKITNDDWWESKIGGDIRIIHRLNQLEGGIYGNVCRYYCKEDEKAEIILS